MFRGLGIRGLSFRGLRFQHTRFNGGPVKLAGCLESVRINNCRNVFKELLIFKSFQKAKISSCQKKPCDNSSVLLLFRKVICKWEGVPGFLGKKSRK